MAQFDIYKNLNKQMAKDYPLLLDVQADVIDSLSTRLIIPLSPKKLGNQIKLLNPEVIFNNKIYILMTHEMAGIHKKSLGDKIGNLANYRSEIIAALDFAFVGF